MPVGRLHMLNYQRDVRNNQCNVVPAPPAVLRSPGPCGGRRVQPGGPPDLGQADPEHARPTPGREGWSTQPAGLTVVIGGLGPRRGPPLSGTVGGNRPTMLHPRLPCQES